jgi:hypothetical protein
MGLGDTKGVNRTISNNGFALASSRCDFAEENE